MENLNIMDGMRSGYLLPYEYMEDMGATNDKIKVYFDFDWETYDSQIIVEGLTNGRKIYLKVPRIPLVGGCFSEFVYGRMLTGQMFVSSILDIVSFNLDFFINNIYSSRNKWNNKVEIIKIDRCFYAPFLYMRNEEGEIEYSEMLKNKYPESIEVLKSLKPNENYWDKYHDNHLI